MITLCRSRGCGASYCEKGVHLVLPDMSIEVHTAPTGSVWHTSKGCTSLAGKKTRTQERSWNTVRYQLCTRCGRMPSEIAVETEKRRKLLPVLKQVLEVHQHVGELPSTEREKLERLLLRIEKIAPSGRIGEAVSELVAKSRRRLEERNWEKEVPFHLVKQAAVRLVEADPDSPAWKQAKKVWPQEHLQLCFESWKQLLGNGGYVSPEHLPGYGEEWHPGRDAALTELHAEWEEALQERLQSASKHLVALKEQESWTPLSGLIRELSKLALVQMEKNPLHPMSEHPAFLVAVPEPLPEVFATSQVSAATLGPVPEGANLPVLVENTLGIWDGESVRSLRAAYQAASAL